MVTLFVRLKLRLLRNGLRGEASKQAGFGVSVVLALAAAVLGFLMFTMLRQAPADLARNVTILYFTVLTFGWIFVPVMVFGLDETLDPARLALFPLTTRQLATGMFAASATGPWPLASLIATIGALVGAARTPGGVLIGVPAVLLEFALCLVASRLVTTALAGALRSRRGRDLLAVAAVLVVVLFQLPNLLMNQGLAGDPAALLASTASVLRWTPPGLAAHAIADGGLTGLAELAVLAIVVAALAWLWIAALQRALVRPDASTQGGAVRRSRTGGILPRGMLGAVVGKELKYIRREPRSRVNWFNAVVVTAVVMVSLHGQRGVTGLAPAVIWPVCLATLVIGIQSANAFGIDGRSLWMNVVAFETGRDLRTDLAGRHLANAIVAVPVLTLVALIAALLAGDPAWTLTGALVAWGVLGVAFGVGSLLSIYLPYTYPERVSAFRGAAAGQGGQTFIAGIGALIGIAVVSLPIVLPVVLLSPWWAVAAVPYGLVIEWAGRRAGASLGIRRLPEIMAAVSRPA